MKPPETIQTRRLILRRPRIEDAAEIFAAYAQDPEVTRFLTWRPHRSLRETIHYRKTADRAWKQGTCYQWLIRRRSDGALVGNVALRPAGFKAEVGYLIARPFWNRGYMTEALRALIRWCLAQRGVYRVWAFCDIENPASARVMQKAGMRKEGVLRRWVVHPNLGAKPRDCFCYAKTK